NVCPIYEVGDVGGRPFIAMQYIRGESLTKAAESLPLHEKLSLMIRVAEALHAAHETGLIHRDVKPANVLVERGPDGALKPFVVDFGLAKELTEPGRTVTGAILGTVAYMAPEQGGGKNAVLDRRADIYGLGATLYHLVSGHPPFTGTSLEIIVRMTAYDPPPLRKVVPDAPRELEAVIMKCLRRAPEERYTTAQQLADDLRRFLAGEPVLAQPVTVVSRIRSFARRNRVASTAVAALILTVMVAAALVVRSQWRARRQANLSRLYAQEASRLEDRVRLIYSRPLHNVRPEIGDLRKDLARIAGEVRRSGDLAVGPGGYALGRGHLALGDFHVAHEFLERAWNSGFREPEVAYALGIALAGEFRDALEQVQRISDPASRGVRLREAETEYRDPALHYLAIGRQVQVQAPEYGEALISFLEHRYDDAKVKARAAVTRIPWLYSSLKLIGDVEVAVGSEARERGAYPTALAAFDRGEQAYSDAARIAPSDPTIYEGQCALWNLDLMTTVDIGQSPKPAFDKAVQACRTALVADSQMVGAHGGLALAHLQWGEYEALHGHDPTSVLMTAVDAAREGLRLRAAQPLLHTYLGIAHLELGRVDAAKGNDPRPSLQEAVTHLDRALELDPRGTLARNTLGLAWLERAFWELGAGVDPRQAVAGATSAFSTFVADHPQSFVALDNLGVAYWTQGHFEVSRGIDPSKALIAGSRALQRALEANPNDWAAYNNLGLIQNDLATYRLAAGDDPKVELDKAFSYFQSSLSISSDSASTYTNLAGAHSLDAEAELARGADPSQSIAATRQAHQKATTINPDDAEAWLILGQAEVVGCRWLVRQGGSPSPGSARALRALGRAISINPRYVEALSAKAEANRILAEWQAGRHLANADAIRNGLAAAGRALRANPEWAAALAEKGRLLLLAAGTATSTRERHTMATSARASLQRAIELNPMLERKLNGVLQHARSLSGAK
ncbi:MAG: protein kinase, partial [Acidobacteria bacterium]|nr:protein kinase [Acidobacteriota bacterium]